MYLMYKYKICLKCVQVGVGVGGVHLQPPCLALFEKEAPPNVPAHQMQQTAAVGDCASLFVMECVLYILTLVIQQDDHLLTVVIQQDDHLGIDSWLRRQNLRLAQKVRN